jgi:hypothetical protein
VVGQNLDLGGEAKGEAVPALFVTLDDLIVTLG